MGMPNILAAFRLTISSDMVGCATVLSTGYTSDQIRGTRGAGYRDGREGKTGKDSPPIHHRITSSARSSSNCGIVRPSAFAVLRLITSSNFVGCRTGRSAGFAPLRILPV